MTPNQTQYEALRLAVCTNANIYRGANFTPYEWRYRVGGLVTLRVSHGDMGALELTILYGIPGLRWWPFGKEIFRHDNHWLWERVLKHCGCFGSIVPPPVHHVLTAAPAVLIGTSVNPPPPKVKKPRKPRKKKVAIPNRFSKIQF